MSVYQERPNRYLYNGKSGKNLLLSARDHIARYRFAADQFAKIPDLRNVGDFGCGIAESTLFLQRLFKERSLDPLLFGLDKNAQAIQEANKKGNDRTNFFVADITTPGLKTSLKDLPSLEGITFVEVLEHISPPEKVNAALKNIKGLLTQGAGRVVISSPNRLMTANDRYHPYNPFHAQELNHQEFLDTISNSGLQIVALYGQRYLPEDLAYRLEVLRYIGKKIPQLREIIGKVMGLVIMLKNPDPNVLPYDHEKRTAPKYFVAVCK